MKVFIIIAATLTVALSQTYQEESPKPYSFNYVAEGEEGTSSHSETADGSGVVRGSYSLSDADGRNRIVEYVAGPEGYNAVIRTNEPGTDNSAPADVTIESSADPAKASQLLNAQRPAQARPVAPATGARQGAGRFVLVPADDPRARAYYAQN